MATLKREKKETILLEKCALYSRSKWAFYEAVTVDKVNLCTPTELISLYTSQVTIQLAIHSTYSMLFYKIRI